jgi:FkbM family methyltransferase
MRTPSVAQSIKAFKACFKKPIDSVLDIGVQEKTQFLIDTFKVARHFLFEPVGIYHEAICNNYNAANISFELIPFAVSDHPGSLFQHLISIDGSGHVTHSQLLAQPDPDSFQEKLLDIIKTPVITLDDWAKDIGPLGSYAIKIDVDGIEDKIIEGGRQVLSKSSIVIVEARLSEISTRIARLESLGLKLFDICGNGYYFDQLQQVDLVFVARDEASKNIDFRPWEKHKTVSWDNWFQY